MPPQQYRGDGDTMTRNCRSAPLSCDPPPAPSRLTHGVCRAISVMASLSIRNSEVFGLGQRGCDKFRNMVEVIEATNDRLGVSATLDHHVRDHRNVRFPGLNVPKRVF